MNRVIEFFDIHYLPPPNASIWNCLKLVFLMVRLLLTKTFYNHLLQ